MKTYRISIAALLLGFAAGAQAGEPADPNLAAAIRHQATQAQESIRLAALADLRADARHHFTDLPADARVVLVTVQPGTAPHQPL